MYLDLENARRAVARGVTVLNQSRHFADLDWRSGISVARLDMWSPADCILGQLFPEAVDDPHESGLAILGLEDQDPADFGFTHFPVPFSEGGFGMEALGVAWAEAVAGHREVIRVRGRIEVEVELDPKTGAVAPTVHLPDFTAYRQVAGPTITEADRLRLLDWSWGELNFESHLRHDVEFTVFGSWSKTGEAVVLSVTTDTAQHAVALAPVANSRPGETLVPVCVMRSGEMIWSAAEENARRADVSYASGRK